MIFGTHGFSSYLYNFSQQQQSAFDTCNILFCHPFHLIVCHFLVWLVCFCWYCTSQLLAFVTGHSKNFSSVETVSDLRQVLLPVSTSMIPSANYIRALSLLSPPLPLTVPLPPLSLYSTQSVLTPPPPEVHIHTRAYASWCVLHLTSNRDTCICGVCLYLCQ